MKRFKKALAMIICCAALMLTCVTTAFAAPSTSDLLRYIPTEITVTSQSVTVKGYFINMNDSVAISNLREFEMAVYEDGDRIITGSFGTLNQFKIQPKSMVYQTFEYNNDGSFNTGTYVCNDATYALINCKYTAS